MKKFSQLYDACIDCGRSDRPHGSRGRCRPCHGRYLYATDPRVRQQKLQYSALYFKLNHGIVAKKKKRIKLLETIKNLQERIAQMDSYLARAQEELKQHEK